MKRLKGIPVSPGAVIGRIFALDDSRRRIPRRRVAAEAVDTELARLDESVRCGVEELERVRDEAQRTMGVEAAKIFSFHIGMLRDAHLIGSIRAIITDERVTAEHAVWRVMSEMSARFAAMQDSAFTTKANDVDDLSSRLLAHLVGEHGSRLDHVPPGTVVIAPDLTPSQTAAFDRDRVVAFVTEFGGRTSHTAIVARAIGIPAVVGCAAIAAHATDGAAIIVDGDRGIVIIDPEPEQIEEYQAYVAQQKLRQLSLEELRNLPSTTLDGVDIELLGNIEFPEEVPVVLDCGGRGVGLYRTEFLYLTGKKDAEPTEDEQYEAYRRCVELLRGAPLTIRTLDLGADKYTQQRAAMPERNPFLGLRSIRLSLVERAVFHRQLRAILRAAAHGPIRVMFPLITTTGELRQAKWLLREVEEDLHEEGVPFGKPEAVGMMVEVPSAAIRADRFAPDVDFFSIGTNDLIQYTLAVDRTNERVAELFSPFHPAVLVLVREVVRAARRRGIAVSCCGESAGDPEFAVLLLGLGVHTLSVTAASIPALKRLVRGIAVEQCERIAKRAIALDSDQEVAALVRDELRKLLPEAFDDR